MRSSGFPPESSVFFLPVPRKKTDKNINKSQEIINNSPDPYGKIKAEDNAKILGNVLTVSANANKTINERLNKAKTAWNSIKT